MRATLLVVLMLSTAAGAQLPDCGDCDLSGAGVLSVTDALEAARLTIGLGSPTPTQRYACDTDGDGAVSILDALRIAQVAVGLPVTLDCDATPVITSCRAVDVLLTTAPGPVGVNPACTTANGGAGNPPASGNIADTSPEFTRYWAFDYVGLNQGAFDTTVQLTDAAGANVGNPVVLCSAGHDYRPVDTDPVAPCNPPDTFQLVLEVIAESPGGAQVLDVAPAGTTYLGTTIRTTWSSSDPGSVTVSPDGLLTAQGENACATITWSFIVDDPGVVRPGPGCSQSGSLVACVDSGGVDTATRATWLPVGDADLTFPGLPSGPPSPAGVGAGFGLTTIVNTGAHTISVYSVTLLFDEAIIDNDETLDQLSAGGSTQPELSQPFAVNPGNPGELRWSDVDAFASHGGIIDLGGVSFFATGAGASPVTLQLWDIADGSIRTLWLATPCMPYSSGCGPGEPYSPGCDAFPLGGFHPIAATGTVTVP